VRIGVDMLAVQSPNHGHRGIGRFGVNLVSALLERDDGYEYVLYVHEDLPDHRVPYAPRASARRIGPETDGDGATVTQRMDRLARINPDGLDVLLLLSAFEPWSDYHPPARPLNGLRMASVVHDLIPFLFPDENVHDPLLMRYYRGLGELTRYDLLLTNSEATRRDCLSVLKLPAEQVVTIGGGCDRRFFVPDRSEPMPASARATLEGLGITRPFVLNVGGLVERKNTWGLIEAFARLPRRLREAYQLALTFSTGETELADVWRRAREVGIDGSLVTTNEVSDRDLRLLYQRCAAFVLPSMYEGFGLPLLEAMQCGAAVIAGNNSSQIEVVGDAGLLANASDPGDIAAQLARVLEEPGLADSLRSRAAAQAGRFSWERTAARAAEALALLPARRRGARLRADPGHARKPRIAFFSPLPPRKSGVSDYSALLLNELKHTYTIDLYHDAGYVPDLGLSGDEFACRDGRLFGRYAAELDYHAVVYQMGNSRYHTYLYETLLRVPGVVTLHDFCLACFHMDYGHRLGREREYIRDELLRWYPEDAEAIVARLKSWPRDWEEVARVCARQGWYLNRRLLASGNLVVVHSPWCLGQIRDTRPDLAERMVVIPLGVTSRWPSEAERNATRDRFGIPRDALMVASFGFVHPEKMGPEALDAFAHVARDDPSALFIFVGEDADGGAVRRHAEALGLGDRVRFLGRTPIADFVALASVTDVGVNLRRPPTNGETSAALLGLLSSGVATIVTDVATFSDYPDHAVRKVRWEAEGPDGLRRALRELAGDRRAREALGRSAWDYVRERHEWPRVAEQYVAVIERSRAGRAGARGDRAAGLRATSRARGVGVDAEGRGG
jgi:glycosyltransferase involved in cell wall biosynthesis